VQVLNKLFPLRVGEEEEYEGLDISEIGVESYPDFVKSKI
jgi:Amt family ammonium transporter